MDSNLSHKTFIPPKEDLMMTLRLIDYLCNQRGIDTNIVSALLDEGKIYADRYGNVVFVGFDGNGRPRFASVHPTHGNEKNYVGCDGSDNRYGFCMEALSSSRLYVLENPMDAISHASLESILTGDRDAWRQDHRLSIDGTSDTALLQYLETHSHVSELVFCLRNDLAGREAAIFLARKYAAKGFYTRIELPKNKNYSEDLIALRKQE